MNGIEDFIKKIIEEAKLQTKNTFEEKVYKDEPIITTASRLKTYMPEKYAEMKRIAGEQNGYLSLSRIFLNQARFMADFEDDYDVKCPFTCYYPTYRMMNDDQLRCYFSWRSKIRRGQIERVSLSYAFVYIYELLALVGADGPADAFCKLKAFSDTYGEIEPDIGPYIDRWSEDFVVYYALSSELLSDCPSYKNSRATEILEAMPGDDELFGALTALSSYNIERSKLFKQYPEETKALMCQVWRDFSAYCEKKKMRPLVQRFFGVVSWHPYDMFDGAVFCDVNKNEDVFYAAGETYKYRRLNGRWYRYSYYSPDKKNRPLGNVMKFADSKLREKHGIAPLKADGTKVLSDIVDKAIEKTEKEAAEKERRTVRVDFSALEQIRKASVKTRESLLTDEEREEGVQVNTDSEEALIETYRTADDEESIEDENGETTADENSYSLTEAELQIIKSILHGENAEASARKYGVILSVAVESINEKLFDAVCDNVIFFDADTPTAEEYYEDFLKGLINE